jgi:hypothetical protein
MQLHKTCFVISLALVLLSGCSRVQSGVLDVPDTAEASASQQEAERNSQQPSTQQESRALEPQIKKGMPYADLRKLIVGSGWRPVVDSECKSNVVGDDFKETCESDPGLESCKICDRLPELSSCSGDAFCGMFFSNGSEKLHVVTFGDFSDWNVTGVESQLSVESWDFSRN